MIHPIAIHTSHPHNAGDGIDELWLTARFYESLDGEFTPIGAQITWMVDPDVFGAIEEEKLPFKAISPITRDQYPPTTRPRKGFGSVVALLGDVDDNGIEDLMVEVGRDCDVSRLCVQWKTGQPSRPCGSMGISGGKIYLGSLEHTSVVCIQGIDFAVVLLQADYVNPIKTFYPMCVSGRSVS